MKVIPFIENKIFLDISLTSIDNSISQAQISFLRLKVKQNVEYKGFFSINRSRCVHWPESHDTREIYCLHNFLNQV